MIRILFVIPHLEYSGATKQLQLLATALPRQRFQVRVCVLDRLGPAAELLREAGIELQSLGWTRLIDLKATWSLRRLVAAFAPSVIHTWGLKTLWFVQLAAGRKCKLVASALEPPSHPGKLQEWLTRRLLERADRVIAYDAAGASLLRQNGAANGKALVIP